MDLSNLKPAKGSTHKRKRIGRGEGSGYGDTATRGHKGAQSRSGYSRKIGFEGGQMPLQRRVPKYGFNNPNRLEYKAINLGDIQKLVDDKKIKKLDIEILIQNGWIQKDEKVKVLGNGELKAKIDIEAHAFSKSAIKAIEAIEGKAIIKE